MLDGRRGGEGLGLIAGKGEEKWGFETEYSKDKTVTPWEKENFTMNYNDEDIMEIECRLIKIRHLDVDV